MLTMRPPPAARMWGSTSREQRISEKSFTSRSAIQFSSVSVSNVPGWAPPALLTRKSIPPSASAERATKSCTCSGSVTSARLRVGDAQLLGRGQDLLLVPGADRDPDALVDELAGDRGAEPFRSSGDERPTPFEAEVHFSRR